MNAPAPATTPAVDGLFAPLVRWMGSQGWEPLDHQIETWRADAAGRSGLIVAPTGSGKTLAAMGGPLCEIALDWADLQTEKHRRAYGCKIIYVTPLRALTQDVAARLRAPLEALCPGATLVDRTGDTPERVRRQIRKRLPTVLVTTPESLALIACRAGADVALGDVRAVVVDEWHSLLESKRGTLLELTLSRLRSWSPRLRTWAVSATIGDPDGAAAHAIGVQAEPVVVQAGAQRAMDVRVLEPSTPNAWPWAGHLGLHLLDDVLAVLDPSVPTLVFTNTRGQAERWYAAITQARPEWFEHLGLHHGSVGAAERGRVESGLQDGRVRIAVCTSSLDLGIDVGGVELVVQIGSARAVSRLVQRAGRSGHRPGAGCRVLCVPTHGIEVLEVDCMRASVAAGRLETVRPPRMPIDVLVQHIVSCAVGDGVEPEALWRSVRATATYAGLPRETFEAALACASTGGRTLQHYPQYRRIAPGDDGRWRVASTRIARVHRMNLGTITAGTAVAVRFLNGRSLGHVEEGFIARLAPGEPFLLQGRTLRLERLEGLVAYVRRHPGQTTNAPRWEGGSLPLSEPLGEAVRARWAEAHRAWQEGAPLAPTVEALVRRQAEVSRLPDTRRLLTERLTSRDGRHLFVYPFAGRRANEAFATLVAHVLGQRAAGTISIAVNDYGFELLAATDYPLWETFDRLDPSEVDVVALLPRAARLAELSKRQFRGIARIAGLTVENYPGRKHGARHLQATSGLIWDVLRQYEPDHLLLAQAEREVIEETFDVDRLGRSWAQWAREGRDDAWLDVPSPLAFPLIVERVRVRVSTESLAERVERMKRQWTR